MSHRIREKPALNFSLKLAEYERELRDAAEGSNDSMEMRLKAARGAFESSRFKDALESWQKFLFLLQPADRMEFRGEYFESLHRYYDENPILCGNEEYAHKAIVLFKNDFLIRFFHANAYGGHKEVTRFTWFMELLKCRYFACGLREQIAANVYMDNCRTCLVAQWHWPMLNDRGRNLKFAEAIRAAIGELLEKKLPKIHVLDVGAGTGILSVIAAKELEKRAKSSEKWIVSAVESNPAMAQVCEWVVKQNEAKVHSHFCNSKDFHHKRPVQLILSELIDVAIFGEKIVETLIDLHERLAAPDGCLVIPRSAAFFVAICESSTIADGHFFEETESNRVFLHPEAYTQGPREHDKLPYDAMHLKNDPAGYRLLSEPQEVLTVDFTSLECLRSIGQGALDRTIKLTPNAEGRAVAVVGWFHSGPEEESCWQQALFPFYPPLQMRPGQVLEAELTVADVIRIQPTNIGRPPSHVERLDRFAPFAAMNNKKLRAFYEDRLTCWAEEGLLENATVLDATGLMLKKPRNVRRWDRYSLQSLFHSDDEEEPMHDCHLVLTFPFNARGQLDYDRLQDVVNLVHLYTDDDVRPIVVPCRMVLQGMLINAPKIHDQRFLVRESKAKETYAGVDLSPMNLFSSNYDEGVELRTLPHEVLSETIELHAIDFRDEKSVSGFVQKDVQLNILPPAIQKQAHAMAVWWELEMESSASRFSFRDLPFAAGAFVFHNEITLKSNVLDTKLSFISGQFFFEIPDTYEPPDLLFKAPSKWLKLNADFQWVNAQPMEPAVESDDEQPGGSKAASNGV